MKKEPSLPITKLRKEKNWNRISDEKGNRVNITKIVIRNYAKNTCKEMVVLEETCKLLDTYNLSKLNQEKFENLNRQIKYNEIESTGKKTVTKIVQD